MKLFFFLAGMVLVLPAAFGIGRSGNGTDRISDVRNGFSATIPDAFRDLQTLSGNRVRLSSILLEPSENGLRKLSLEVSGVKEGLPDLAKLSRSELPMRMKALAWEEVSFTDPCVLAFRQSTDTSDTLALFWGGEKGLVAIGPKSNNVAAALETLRSSLKLKAGACAW